MNHRSFYLQSNYGLMTCFLSTKIAHAEENLLTVKKNCSQNQICSKQKFAHRICSQHRKIDHNEKPCRLGWINITVKFGWRLLLNGLSLNGWNMLELDLPGGLNSSNGNMNHQSAWYPYMYDNVHCDI